jgi:hypothetical protein
VPSIRTIGSVALIGLGERATLELELSHFLPTCDCVAWTSEASAARTNQAKPMIITALIMAQFRIKKVDWGRKMREIMSFSQQRVFYVTNQIGSCDICLVFPLRATIMTSPRSGGVFSLVSWPEPDRF